MKPSFLIVGAGLFGATFARRAAEAGHRVLVIDRRTHIAGNCYTKLTAGIHVHQYGPHIFHTSSEKVWKFVNQFAQFNDYVHRGCVYYRGRHYSFPINLRTLKQVYNVESNAEALAHLEQSRQPINDPQNMREWLLSQVGEHLYETFFEGYTRKQWGRDPSELPASIARRIPIREVEDDRYYGDAARFQGIPVGGYTQLVANLLDHRGIEVELGVDFLEGRDAWSRRARRVVYSGPIDAYFDHRYGRLGYRSLRLEHETHKGWFQRATVLNYTDADVPFTRITEHKHFTKSTVPGTVITREYPEAYTGSNEPYYPIRDAANLGTLDKYRKLAKDETTIFGGRLGSYQYLDMDQVIAQALHTADLALNESPHEQKHHHLPAAG